MNLPITALGEIAELRLGKMLDAQKNKGKPYPYLRNPNVQWMRVDLSALKNMPFEDHELDRYGLRAGDVVICEGGEAGRAAVWDGSVPDMKIQKAIHRVRVGKHLDSRFLVHRLMYDYFRGSLSDYYTGATIKHLTGQDLARYEFPLPPLDEQRRIAAILDAADSLRAKRRAALAKLDQLAQSIFIDMFGDPTLNPRAWPLRTCAELCNRITVGIVVKPASYYRPTGIPALRSQNIKPNKIVTENLVYFSEIDNRTRLAKTRLRHGDVILVRTGQPGTAAVVPVELDGINAIDILIATPNQSQVRPLYICSFFNSDSGKRLVLGAQRGQIQQHLNVGSLNDTRIPVPPIELQDQFVEAVGVLDGLRKLKAASAATFDNFFASVQNRAFRGGL